MTGIDLDDTAAVEAADPAGMLRAVASSAAQVREAGALAAEAGLGRLAGDGRPRAIVVVGMGGSGVAGDVLAAVAGPSCPVPIWRCKDYVLPGWVGAADLVMAVSCSGSTEETLAATDEAIRRGCRLLAVGGDGSPLSARAEQARALFVVVPGGRQPRASIWALSVPLLLAADALGLLGGPLPLTAAAERLEQVAGRCHPARDSFVNPAKELATALSGRLISVWGTTPMTGAAAYRFCCQLNENAKLPALQGLLPEADHNQVVAYDGPWAPGRRGIFAGPEDDPAAPALHQVLLRDQTEEHPQVTRRADVGAELAAERGVRVTQLAAEGESRLERLASLIALTDYVSVYLGILAGLDPTPVHSIETLKGRIA